MQWLWQLKRDPQWKLKSSVIYQNKTWLNEYLFFFFCLTKIPNNKKERKKGRRTQLHYSLNKVKVRILNASVFFLFFFLLFLLLIFDYYWLYFFVNKEEGGKKALKCFTRHSSALSWLFFKFLSECFSWKWISFNMIFMFVFRDCNIMTGCRSMKYINPYALPWLSRHHC